MCRRLNEMHRAVFRHDGSASNGSTAGHPHPPPSFSDLTGFLLAHRFALPGITPPDIKPNQLMLYLDSENKSANARECLYQRMHQDACRGISGMSEFRGTGKMDDANSIAVPEVFSIARFADVPAFAHEQKMYAACQASAVHLQIVCESRRQ